MLRFLAASWLTRRLIAPLSRLIPNPFLRAAAIAGTSLVVTRMVQKGTTRR